MATLINVAERAGVSVTTISRMLNNRVNVSEKTRKKVMAAMKDLDYYPNEIAQSLTKKKSNFIGLIVPSAKNFFYSQVIEYTEYYAVKKGYKLLLCISNHEPTKEHEYFGMLKANKVAGIIIASRTQNLQDYLNIDSPLISIDRIISSNIPSICSDNYHGGTLAARHLINKECKSLAYISGSSDLEFEANKRYFGFRDTCLINQVSPPIFLDATEERFFSMDYQEIVAELFETSPHVDGIFTSNDIIAAQIIQYCRKHNIDIPQKVKLVGYDDTDLALLCTPSLSTIHQPINEICFHAVEGIYHQSIEGIIPKNIVLPVSFIERETT
ncbi:MAG: transcriptional regulator, LacI family [Herbinix sp.]|jgi:LacI family sucrose operon transcriptional repressor|nr:transcriptional regulator, LacI family [Herbinix sp.]